MNFEPKISGTRVTDFNIKPIFNSQFIWLSEAMEKIQRQETMNFLLDDFRFTKGSAEKSHDWVAIIDYDTIAKLSILENYPEYEKEMIEYFGENWLKHYIRFNHQRGDKMDWREKIQKAMNDLKQACAENKTWTECYSCPFTDYCDILTAEKADPPTWEKLET